MHRRDLHSVSKRNRFALENTEAIDLKIAISTINKVEVRYELWTRENNQ